MAAEERSALVNYRPLTLAALGFGLGVALSMLASGIWRIAAVCPLAVLAAYFWRRDRRSLYIPLFFAALGALRCMAASLLPAPADGALSGIIRLFIPVKNALADNLDALFADDSPLVRAILLGDRETLDAGVYAVFRDSGVAHVLALSGLHVSMLSGALMLVLPKRFPRARFAVVAAFLAAYCAIAAFPASLVRASVMTLYYLAAACFKRRRDALCSLSAAFITILAFSPYELGEVGFQLSFAAVLGIALLYKPICRVLSFLPKSVNAPVSVSMCGTLGTLPLTLVHFSRLNTYAVLANVFLLPLVPFAVIPAFAAMLALGAAPWLANALAWVARLFFDAFVYLGGAFASVPYAVLEFSALSAVPLAISAICFYPAMFAVSPYVLRDGAAKLKCAAGLLFASALLLVTSAIF